MANSKRAYRWFLFFVALGCFVYVVFVRASVPALALFFVSGGLWYWRERRKTRELDAPQPKYPS